VNAPKDSCSWQEVVAYQLNAVVDGLAVDKGMLRLYTRHDNKCDVICSLFDDVFDYVASNEMVISE